MSTVRASLRIYLGILFSLWCFAVCAVFVQGRIFHKAYPYDTFLMSPSIRFTDFTIFDPRFKIWDHTGKFFALPGFPFTYPAPLLVAFLGYWKLTPYPLYAYLGTVIVFALFAAAYLAAKRPVLCVSVICTLLASYPLLFLLDRSNIEGLVWITAAMATVAFARRRFTTSAVLFGLATGMKIFPGALLLLFVAKRRRRDLATGILSAVISNIVSLAIAGPSIPGAFRGVLGGMDFFRHFEIFTYRRDQIGFEHSLFSCLKQFLHLVLRSSQRTDGILPSVYLPYMVVAGTVFCGLYWLRLRNLPVLNQMIALTGCSVLLPFISYDYTLVHIYTPFAALLLYLATDVASGRAELPLRHALAFLAPCAVLFAPLSWMLISGTGCGGQVKALALVTLIGAAAMIPLPSSLFGDFQSVKQSAPAPKLIRILETEPVHSLS